MQTKSLSLSDLIAEPVSQDTYQSWFLPRESPSDL